MSSLTHERGPVHVRNKQLNTTYRCKYYFKMKIFKPVQHTVLTTFFQECRVCITGRREVFTLHCKTRVSRKLHTFQDSKLRTMVLGWWVEWKPEQWRSYSHLCSWGHMKGTSLLTQNSLGTFKTVKWNIKTLTNKVPLDHPEHWKMILIVTKPKLKSHWDGKGDRKRAIQL